MLISSLQVTGFRNLQSIDFKPSSQFNVFYGQNGAGKTSILEAIYYLGLGRSFRTSLSARLIQKDTSGFSLFARLLNETTEIPVGIERLLDGSRRIRYNGEKIASVAPLAQQLPIQLISTDSYRYFHDGPKIRRQFLNWGLFHVKPSFFPLWQRLLQLLKQRNAALKAKQPLNELSIWNADLIDVSEQIDALRIEYVSQLQPVLDGLLSRLLSTKSLNLSYLRGWDQAQDYASSLETHFYKDQAIGYTSTGPQRADLQLFINDTPAQDHLSQGEQKLAAYALYLAQGLLLQELSGKAPIYLIDDLPSELDPEKRICITNILSELQTQVFITGITTFELKDVIKLENAQVFHVEHGRVRHERAQHQTTRQDASRPELPRKS